MRQGASLKREGKTERLFEKEGGDKKPVRQGRIRQGACLRRSEETGRLPEISFVWAANGCGRNRDLLDLKWIMGR